LDWPSDEESLDYVIAHQVLRWLNGEELVRDLVARYERSPLKAWLDDPSTAELVTRV
jgi:hypothetical protein